MIVPIESSGPQVRSNVLANAVMGRQAPLLASFLAKDEPGCIAVLLKITHLHSYDGADPNESVQHDGENRAVAQGNQAVRAIQRVEETASFIAIEDRRFAFVPRKAQSADGTRRVRRQQARAREPFEPLADAGEVQVRARGAEPLDELVEVGGDERGGEGREGDAARFQPAAELRHRAPVGGASMGVRDASGEELDRVEDGERSRCGDGTRQPGSGQLLVALGASQRLCERFERGSLVWGHRRDPEGEKAILSGAANLVKCSVLLQSCRRPRVPDFTRGFSSPLPAPAPASPRITHFMGCESSRESNRASPAMFADAAFQRPTETASDRHR